MKTDLLIQESVINSLVTKFSDFISANSFDDVEPTALVSNFWATTFTPSSSEIIFRHLWKNDIRQICTCIPCIRITDLPFVGDGWHLLFFHMLTSVVFDQNKYNSFFYKMLSFLASTLSISVEDFYYVVSTNSYMPDFDKRINLGVDTLKNWGIDASHMFISSGTMAYQDASLVTGNKKRIAMDGPKVEVLVRTNSGEYREIATFEIAIVRSDGIDPVPAAAFVFGVERTATQIAGLNSIAHLPNHRQFLKDLSGYFLDKSFEKGAVGEKIIVAPFALTVGLYKATEATKNLVPFTNKGLGSHYQKIMRELYRELTKLGIDYSAFFHYFEENLGVDFNLVQKRYTSFLSHRLEENYRP